MRTKFITVVVGVMLGTCWTGLNSADAKNRQDNLPLVLIGDEASLSPAVADFYQALNRSLSEDPKWRPVARQDVLRHLGLAPGGLPMIPSGTANGITERMQPETQRLVDTLALTGALLLRCQVSASDAGIESCELAYYEAKQAKVTAKVRKDFKVPIYDASLWAGRLLAKLRTGMAAHSEHQTQVKLRTALARQKKPSKRYRALVQTSGFGEQSGSHNTGLRSVAGFGLTLGVESDYSYAGLLYEQGQARGSSQSRATRLERSSYGLAFGVASPAMTAMLWDLTVAGGYSQRLSEIEGRHRLTQNQPFIGMQPGLFWRMHDRVGCGLYLSYRQYMGGTTKRSGAAASLSSHIIGTGLAVRAQF